EVSAGFSVFSGAGVTRLAESAASEWREREGSALTRLMEPVSSATEMPPSSRLRRRRRRGAPLPSSSCAEVSALPRRSRSLALRPSSSATVNSLSSAMFLIQSLVSPAQDHAFRQCPRADLQLVYAKCTHGCFGHESTSNNLV